MLVLILAIVPSCTVAAGPTLTFSLERKPGYTLSGTVFEVAGDTPDSPDFSIGIQGVVQTGMPSYSELLTIFVKNNGMAVWRDLGQPFSKGNFVWLVALDNQLIAIDRQDVAPPRKLIANKEPQWGELSTLEFGHLDRYLRRSRSDLRRPRLRGGPFTIQVVRAGRLEICRRNPEQKESCQLRTMPPGNDILYTVAEDEEHIVLFANEGWFRLENDGALHPAWLRADDPRRSNQVYTAVRTGRGILLGHYPTGDLLTLTISNGRVSASPFFGSPPYTAPARRNGRELQSLASYGGRFLAGVWPWGELYEFRTASGWRMIRRMFQAPEISDELAPYAEAIIESTQPDLTTRLLNRLYSILPDWSKFRRTDPQPDQATPDPDVWGQRITQLVPLGPSLYLATGNKSGEYKSKWLNFLPSPKLANEYGKVYEITFPGNLACNLPQNGTSLDLEISIVGHRLEVRADGNLLCSLSDTTIPLAAKSLRTGGILGYGMYGKLIGGHVSLIHKVEKGLFIGPSRLPATTLPKMRGHAPFHVRPTNIRPARVHRFQLTHSASYGNVSKQP